MDSRLLNVFHDEPFDGSYTQLNTNFWDTEHDTMGQLTETLNGILPIPADADHDTDIYSSSMLAEDNFHITNKINAATSLQDKDLLQLGFEDFTQQQLHTDGAIEIITVDPNSLDTDSDDDSDDNEDDIDDIYNGKAIVVDHEHFDDNQSQYSEATFRTRTDSSSIADYESHTSDYDDSSDDDENANDNTNNQHADISKSNKTDMIFFEADQIPDLTAGLLAADGIDLNPGFQLPLENIAIGNKIRTISTNTIDSDVDVNNFDLAEFITNDDLTLSVPKRNETIISKAKPQTVFQKKPVAIPVKQNNIDIESDADSDVIVDIETVDVDNDKSLWEMTSKNSRPTNVNVNTDVVYEDNIEKDPSWCPKSMKKQETIVKETKARPATTTSSPANPTNANLQNTRSFTIIPSKRQCDILKGKVSAAKNKPSSKHSQGKTNTKQGPETTVGNAPKAGSLTCRVGVGQGGKNLALCLQNNKSSETEEKNLETPLSTLPETQVTPNTIEKPATEQTTLSVKRKLNLEEYKRRRGDNTPTTAQIEGNMTTYETQMASKSTTQNTHVKHSAEVTSVVKILRNQTNQKTTIDPITEAKNKVLRMQELKRAQQLKIIDSTISAKVPRVTKLPPLKEIVKDTCYADKTENSQSSPNTKSYGDYEELIIVSAGSNTEISIPPMNILPINTCERSLLKSSALLYHMPSGLTSSSSLIASIQDVVVQKVVGPRKATNLTNVATTSVAEKTQKEAEQHGEDKVIMHLRKDRIRPCTVSIGIQTDLQPGFARLPKIERKRRTQRNYRRRNDKIILDDTDSDTSNGRSRNRHRNRSRSRSPVNRSRSRSADSYASSMERSGARQCDPAGGYSSRSSRRHRSSISSSYSESGRASRNTQQKQRTTSYKKRNRKYSRHSSASSVSSSDSDHSYRSRSRSRSRSPYYRRSYSRSPSRSRSISHANNRFRKPGGNNKNLNISQPAVEERRIVYVGRIEEETTKEMLRRKFLPYGTIKQISIHYKDNGMKYGFVTYERSEDAFTVIDSSARDATINMYDISFGGRRAFCRSSYADLDNAGINTYHSIVFPKVDVPKKEEDSFEALLQKVKAKMNANKSGAGGKNTTKA